MRKFSKTYDPDGNLMFFVQTNTKMGFEVSPPLLLSEPVHYPDETIVALSLYGGRGAGALWRQEDLDFLNFIPQQTINTPDWLIDDVSRKMKKIKRTKNGNP